MEDRGEPRRVPTKAEVDELYAKARRSSLDGRAPPFVPGIGLSRLSQDLNAVNLTNSNDATGSPTAEDEPEVKYRGKLVVRTHRKVGSLTPARSDAGSSASSVASRSDASRSDAGSPEPSYIGARSDAGSPASPASSYTGARSAVASPASPTSAGTGSPIDESKAEVIRHGKVIIRSYRNLAPLTMQAETMALPAREKQQTTSRKDMTRAPPLPRRPEKGVDRDDPVSRASAWEQTLAMRANGAGAGSSADATGGRINKKEIQVGPAETLDLRVFCGTWNVAGRKLDDAEDLGLWLDIDTQDDAEGDASDAPDMFVIGFQEVVELSAQNVVMDSFLDTQSRSNSLQWFAQVYAYLAHYGKRHGVKYAMISEQRLLGTYVLVMAKQDLCSKIAHVQSAVVPTGLGGYLGNKGAVAVRMEVGGRASLCFVCAHMAAHREHVLARNAEYKVISSKPVFADTTGRVRMEEEEDVIGNDKDEEKNRDRGASSGGWGGLFGAAGQAGRSGGMSPTRATEVKKAIRAAMAFGLPKGGGGGGGGGHPAGGAASGKGQGSGTDGSQSGAGKGTSVAKEDDMDDFAWMPSDERMCVGDGLPKTRTVLQADIVFWLGDLNYRIAEEIPDEDVFEMLKKDDLETLRELDQLTIARNSGTAFEEFQEGPLCFPPSYKYIPGTKEFDNRPEKKVRCPSWCDRVLYSVGMQSGSSVRRLGLDKYWSSGPLLSDHMPVSALFRTSLACAPQITLIETDIEVEPISPRRAAAEAAFDSSPFARVVLEPPALMLVLDQTPLLSAVVEITNTGGMQGNYHVCEDSVPSWMSLDGNERGELDPGEKVKIGIVIDVAEAEAAAEKDSKGGPRQPYDRPAACAVLRVEVDGGGSGTMLPVVCNLDDDR